MFGDLSYTSRTITSIRQEIIDYIKANNTDWADFNESSIQMQYSEMLAGVADMLCYYLDEQALETFLETARQPKNVRSLLRSMNYEFEIIGAAQGKVTFSRRLHEGMTDGASTSDPVYESGRLTIPQYTIITSTDKTVPQFVTTEAVTMAEADLSKELSVVQGEVHTIEFPMSTVSSSFKLQIAAQEVPVEYVKILTDGWVKVDDAFIETSGGKKYSVHIDSNGNTYILFTFDWKKYLTTGENDKMEVLYLTTSGSYGNVSSGKLDTIASVITDADTGDDSTAKLSVTNAVATYGGFDTVDLEKHKANARNYIRTYDRIILLSDLETMVRKESWVKDCVVYDWRKDDTIVKYPHQMVAWVVTADGNTASSEELTALQNKLQDLTVVMTTVNIYNASFVDTAFTITLTISGSNTTSKEAIRKSVEDTVNSWYCFANYVRDDSNTKLGFGVGITLSKLMYDIKLLNTAISDVAFSISSDVDVSKTQFLNCSKIEVKL